MPPVKDIIISANEITEFNIHPSSPTNTRNDQSSVIKLDDGTLVCGYSRFGDTPTDIGQSQVYISKSTDNGVTWSAGELLIDQISEGSYIPSFYKKSNGNILVVFFVRELGTTESTIRAVEYDTTLTNIVTPVYTIISGADYTPVASDRLFYDKKNNKLLYPFPVLTSGPGTSYLSVYHTKMIYSNDEGATWIDSGILIQGKLDVKGFGGAIEPGLFQNIGKITMYARNTVGTIYGNDITWNGTTYISSATYSLGLLAQNSMSSIKFDEESRLFIASYTKLKDLPVGSRQELGISVSKDALNWNESFILVRSELPYLVNEPSIFINDEDIVFTYSVQPNANRWDLICKRFKKSFFSATDKRFRSFATNPTNERNEIAISEYDINAYPTNTFGNIVRTNINVTGIVTNQGANKSFYGDINQLSITGKGTSPEFELDVIAGSSSQAVFKDVKVGSFFSYFAGITTSNVVNSFVSKLAVYGANLIAPIGSILDMYGLYITGDRSRNYLEGSLSIGKEKVDTGVKLDVVGKIQATGGDSDKWNNSYRQGDLNLSKESFNLFDTSNIINDYFISSLGNITVGIGWQYIVIDLTDVPDLSYVTFGGMTQPATNYWAFYETETTGKKTNGSYVYGNVVTIQKPVGSNFLLLGLKRPAESVTVYQNAIVNLGSSILPKYVPFRSERLKGIDGYKFELSVGYDAPASPTAHGIKGEIRMTADYTYTCIATNTWKRTATDATWV